MENAYDLDLNRWRQWTKQAGLPAYRADQIYKWLCRGVYAVDEMTDIPRELRGILAAEFNFQGLRLEQKLQSQLDETRKYVFLLPDGNRIETVRMIYKHGQSVCISSQAGCRMGCTFCASAGAGFGRSLTQGEMLAQVALVRRDSGIRVSNVVIMGIGEPLDNYDNLIRFLHQVNDPDGLNVGMRHISVSTCGVVPEMLKFTDEGLPVTLSVSLHAPNDVIRRRLMPIARRYPLKELLAACRYHTRKTGRRISVEYALLDGVNDQPEHAGELASLLKGLLCHVNLIPANTFEGIAYGRSRAQNVRNFQQRLVQLGVNATIRRELGSDIMAACGQLRRSKEICGEA